LLWHKHLRQTRPANLALSPLAARLCVKAAILESILEYLEQILESVVYSTSRIPRIEYVADAHRKIKRVSSNHHSAHKRKRFVALAHEPLKVLLEHPIRTVLVDSILRGAGLPTPIAEGVRSIFVDSHYTSTMQRDAHATIAQDFRIGVVSNLATILVGLTTNHANCFGVCHKFPFRVLVLYRSANSGQHLEPYNIVR